MFLVYDVDAREFLEKDQLEYLDFYEENLDVLADNVVSIDDAKWNIWNANADDIVLLVYSSTHDKIYFNREFSLDAETHDLDLIQLLLDVKQRDVKFGLGYIRAFQEKLSIYDAIVETHVTDSRIKLSGITGTSGSANEDRSELRFTFYDKVRERFEEVMDEKFRRIYGEKYYRRNRMSIDRETAVDVNTGEIFYDKKDHTLHYAKNDIFEDIINGSKNHGVDYDIDKDRPITTNIKPTIDRNTELLLAAILLF